MLQPFRLKKPFRTGIVWYAKWSRKRTAILRLWKSFHNLLIFCVLVHQRIEEVIQYSFKPHSLTYQKSTYSEAIFYRFSLEILAKKRETCEKGGTAKVRASISRNSRVTGLSDILGCEYFTSTELWTSDIFTFWRDAREVIESRVFILRRQYLLSKLAARCVYFWRQNERGRLDSWKDFFFHVKFKRQSLASSSNDLEILQAFTGTVIRERALNFWRKISPRGSFCGALVYTNLSLLFFLKFFLLTGCNFAESAAAVMSCLVASLIHLPTFVFEVSSWKLRTSVLVNW